ncbi:MAG: 4Fe-4S cluster-binding domain-containing protein, partial [Acetatifactor sp.]|nr:4Fe-4S cluster-binding domain-containing protein [Acetatifactor sp.]
MIHQFKNNGYNIVMDVNSGSIHVVDEIVYDMIALIEPLVNEGIRDADTIRAAVLHLVDARYSPAEAEEALQEVLALQEAGQLFSPDIYENYVFDFKNRQTVVKALCLHIAHDCNLACRYCFAEEGEYHGRRALMSFEVGKKALDFLVENSGSRVNLEVDFFGGEPLMNWQVVKDLVAYGRSLEEPRGKKFRFTLTTNGVLLDDEILECANREMANVVCS